MDGSNVGPAPILKTSVEQVTGVSASRCYQCHRCTAGCPVIFAMDTTCVLTPNDEVKR
jgi:Fe-S-cluster-containing hydrogenase component 2